MQKKQGGARKNAGRKPKYKEPTTTVSFRVPESFVPELKEYVVLRLEDYKL